MTIRYGIHLTPFGKCLIGLTERGICHLGFVSGSEGEAIDTLVNEWKEARMIEDYRSTAVLVEPIFNLQYNTRIKPLTLHLRGSNFQIKVWEALLQIPVGAATTYEGLAQRIGRPFGIRYIVLIDSQKNIPILQPQALVDTTGFHFT